MLGRPHARTPRGQLASAKDFRENWISAKRKEHIGVATVWVVEVRAPSVREIPPAIGGRHERVRKFVVWRRQFKTRAKQIVA